MTTRRGLLAGAAALAIGWRPEGAHSATPPDAPGLAAELARIEAASGGRLGVAVLDTETGLQAAHRGGERFPMCSTFKVVAVAAILANVDAGRETLSRRIRFTRRDLVAYSPVTQHRVGAAGMSLGELCQAALNYGDNTAANFLLHSIGGPAGVTRYARSIGDDATRLDRWETSLNEALPGDPRDTTTPEAMLGILHKVVLGPALSAASRDRLAAWLQGCETGAAKLRAGIPADWRIGDKTGGGGFGSNNDVGVIWPPQRRPVLVAAYLTGTSATPAQRDATIAAVGRAAALAIG